MSVVDPATSLGVPPSTPARVRGLTALPLQDGKKKRPDSQKARNFIKLLHPALPVTDAL
jgi:hypothetical protein